MRIKWKSYDKEEPKVETEKACRDKTSEEVLQEKYDQLLARVKKLEEATVMRRYKFPGELRYSAFLLGLTQQEYPLKEVVELLVEHCGVSLDKTEAVEAKTVLVKKRKK